MHPRSRRTRGRLAVALAALATLAGPALAQPPAPPAAPLSLRALFDAAWALQPEARALAERRDAAQAQRRAADAWTPEPPALEVRHQTDRLGRDDGAREVEVGVAVPLWLPGERQRAAALAHASGDAVESRAQAARLRLAGVVREAWWAGQRAAVEVEITRQHLHTARGLADDVARRVQAGELARADQHQAEATVAAAEAALAQARAAASAAQQHLKALAGPAFAPVADALAAPATGAEPEPSPGESPAHPALAELQDRATVAERAAALLATQSRAHPELTVATTRERGAAGEPDGQKVSLALRLPFGDGPRHDARVALARAEATEAQAQRALDATRLQAERDSAVARVEAARVTLAAAERRATLARETRGFFDKSFRLGQSDLPTRLRVEADALDAERQAARSRIDLAAAVSAWRQALGLLPP